MTKAERLLRLLTLLQSRRRAITAAELADVLQVSERTIYRDVQSLSLSGVPIEGEAGVGYVLRKGSTLAPLMFDEDEIEALILGVRMVQGWGDPALGQTADRALDKIRAILPERLHYLQAIPGETLLVPDHPRPELLSHSQPLREAIKQQYKINVAYETLEGESSERVLWPLGLVYWGKVWTLIAWCELRTAYRVFRLDRIGELTMMDETFSPSNDRCLKDYLNNHKVI